MEPGFYTNYSWDKFGIRVDSSTPIKPGGSCIITGKLLRPTPCGWRVVDGYRGDTMFFVQDVKHWKKIEITH